MIQLDDRSLFKITQTVNGHRWLVEYAATIAAITKHVDLADLVEVLEFPAKDLPAAPG
ncbi:hypothetical protein [Nonomuraea angiospora]|uniref:hypothetical protein n=1 Tax=Nonomuraea angiospora TaxID=46172 RepID=UPI0029BE5E6D|nr:hypothetical protein [Nonomuraea angiospora]MDX3101767.1 hypothetical protein [Nonomuraea angiospora]